ncbi:hypothetical protein E1A91_A13G017800v1 [Gossypium mustelinum]|uniref:Uncharacterized protein n=3 Tax=Gossypium TaxID=3633 RepID=A0A5J5SWN8_GOSBA|nr:hypothetical protein ES319_A13G018600v1 [Gossypium barbadense]TYG84983.1 hypothetical protein ES288_A13G016400v1 [Gossypium darwinii]TYI99441.1 hypothetical protein E1A91_A13G017800v1 [Gossypium mustelinum]
MSPTTSPISQHIVPTQGLDEHANEALLHSVEQDGLYRFLTTPTRPQLIQTIVMDVARSTLPSLPI